jgi:hypothetical protein
MTKYVVVRIHHKDNSRNEYSTFGIFDDEASAEDFAKETCEDGDRHNERLTVVVTPIEEA